MTPYRAHRVLAGTGDNPSSSGVMEKASKRVGTLGKLVQASFFDDAEEVRMNVYIYIPAGSIWASNFCSCIPSRVNNSGPNHYIVNS